MSGTVTTLCLSLFKDMHVWLVDNSELSVAVILVRCLSLCGTAINLQLVRGVIPPTPQRRWEGLQQPLATLSDRKQMDERSKLRAAMAL